VHHSIGYSIDLIFDQFI